MEEKTLTYEELMRGFAEIRVLQENTLKGFAEIRESLDKTAKDLDDFKKWQQEAAKDFREQLKKQQEENAKSAARVDLAIEKTQESIRKTQDEVRKLNNTVNGVSKSNGMMAEEFFYNSLKATKTFGGVHFDKVKKNLYGNASKKGENLEGEYDITMINGDSLCIVETKYRVRPNDISDLVKRRLTKFRKLLPKYAGYKIYLGIGGMSFENDKSIEKKAKEFGVGILKLNGDVVEIYDKNLKVY
jgi:hypothetical protein